MKTVLVAPRSAVREMVVNTDVLKMLGSGSWVQVGTVRPLNKNAIKQRNLRHNRSEQGAKRFTAYLQEDEFVLLESVKREGETHAELLTRLLRLARLIG